MAGRDYLQYRIAEQMRVLVTDSNDSIDRLFAVNKGSLQNPSAIYERLKSQYTNRNGNDLKAYRDFYKAGTHTLQSWAFDLDALDRSLPRSQGNLPGHQWRLIESLRADINNLRHYDALPEATRNALREADHRLMKDPKADNAEKARLRHFIHADGETISPEGLVRRPPEPRRMTVERLPAAPQKQRIWSAHLGNDAMVNASLDVSNMPAEERNRIIQTLKESGVNARFEPSSKNKPASIHIQVEPTDANKLHAAIENLQIKIPRLTGSHQINSNHWEPIREFIQPVHVQSPSHSTPTNGFRSAYQPHQPHALRAPRVHAPRVPGAVAGATIAATAGVVALATGTTPAQAAQVTGEAALSTIPGVSGRLAPNRDEAAVRDRVDIATLAGTTLSAGAGAIIGTPLPFAGNVAGAAILGAIGNQIVAIGADEYYRLWARYGEGKKDTVAPSMGEQLFMATLSTSIEKSVPAGIMQTDLRFRTTQENMLKDAGLGEKDKDGRKAADYLRDPKTRDAYLGALKDSLAKETNPKAREQMAHQVEASEKFVEMEGRRVARLQPYMKDIEEKLAAALKLQHLAENFKAKNPPTAAVAASSTAAFITQRTNETPPSR